MIRRDSMKNVSSDRVLWKPETSWLTGLGTGNRNYVLQMRFLPDSTITEVCINWIKQNNPRIWAWGPRGNGTEKTVSSVSRKTNKFENRWVKHIAALSSWALQISIEWGSIYRQHIPAGSNWIKPDQTSSNQIPLHPTRKRQFKPAQIRSKRIKLHQALKSPLQHDTMRIADNQMSWKLQPREMLKWVSGKAFSSLLSKEIPFSGHLLFMIQMFNE